MQYLRWIILLAFWLVSNCNGLNEPLHQQTTYTHEPINEHTATVIFLHGLGDRGDSWKWLGEYMNLPWIRFVFPTAPWQAVSINGGRSTHAWYDIKSLDKSRKDEDKGGLLRTKSIISRLIEKEWTQSKIPPKRIVIGGFSQGAVSTLFAGLTLEDSYGPVAGILSVGGFLAMKDEVFQSRGDEPFTTTPVLALHGIADHVIPIEYATSSYQTLIDEFGKSNINVQSYAGVKHGVNEDMLADMRKFILDTIPHQSSEIGNKAGTQLHDEL